jgi:biotin synthase-related radical SAM superfamily protein
MVKTDAGKYEIWENARKYTDVAFMPRPKYYDLTTWDGVPMSDVAVIGEPDHLRSVLNQKCYYQQIGKSCKFCAIESWWAGFMDKTPKHVAQVAEAACKEGMAKHVTLSTGTRNSEGKGLEDLVIAAQLIHEKVDMTKTLNFEPLTNSGIAAP